VPSRWDWLIRKVLGVPFKDFGCTLRVVAPRVFDAGALREMHRFITRAHHATGRDRVADAGAPITANRGAVEVQPHANRSRECSTADGSFR